MKYRLVMENPTPKPRTRRDFLGYTTAAFGGTLLAAGGWGVLRAMAPDASVLAEARLSVDLNTVPIGGQLMFAFENKPIFVRRLTDEQAREVAKDEVASLMDPKARNENLLPDTRATIENRTVFGNGEFVFLDAWCPRRRCVPLFDAGDFGGWFCPCGGSHFDVLGRMRKGIAPSNMRIPRYTVSAENLLTVYPDRIGPSRDEIQKLLFGQG